MTTGCPVIMKALAKVMMANHELGFVYDDGYDVTVDCRLLDARTPEPNRLGTNPDDLLLEQRFPPAAVMSRRSVFDRVGGFDETLRNCADHDMWLRIVEQFPVAHVDVYGFCYRLHAEQMSLSPRLWTAAERVLDMAIRRYPYRRDTIRKRRAVIAFRFSQIALRDHKLVRAGMHLGKAAILDPPRAAGELWRRLRKGIGRPSIVHET